MPDTGFITKLGPVKILLVDDREENLLALSTVLKHEGYQLIEASSGREAIEKASLHDFAAILLDVQMPDMDGFETAKIIRQRESSKNTPIIFVTAIHRTEAYASKGYFSGGIDYLYKPIDTDILKAKLAILTELYKKTQEVCFQNQRLQLQAKQELEASGLRQAIAARDEFLSMASHELKTPITPLSLQMQSFLRMVRNKTLKTMDDDRLERMLITAYSQVERLSATIDKLLDVSRFTTGTADINLQVFNLTEIVKSIVDSFELEFKSIGSSVSLVTPKQEVSIVCDRFRIEQVFINLLSNSMKYGAGGPIEIFVDTVNENAVLKVKDSGIGIAKEDQERIFQRFERAAPSKNYGGLGLGLYISGQILKHHDGTITVESELGHGATFIVQLPLYVRPNEKKS